MVKTSSRSVENLGVSTPGPPELPSPSRHGVPVLACGSFQLAAGSPPPLHPDSVSRSLKRTRHQPLKRSREHSKRGNLVVCRVGFSRGCKRLRKPGRRTRVNEATKPGQRKSSARLSTPGRAQDPTWRARPRPRVRSADPAAAGAWSRASCPRRPQRERSSCLPRTQDGHFQDPPRPPGSVPVPLAPRQGARPLNRDIRLRPREISRLQS